MPSSTPPSSKGAAAAGSKASSRQPAAASSWERELVGQTLGDCRLLRIVDSGSLSTVYEGHHNRLDLRVAVKVFRKRKSVSAKALMRFYAEARQAARLDHPNIVRVYDVDSTDECHYIVMQYVDGKTLAQILEAKGRLTPKEVVSILGQTLNGLAYAHRRKCVHRDIKPDNLMMTRDGILKITDFGLAREAGVTAMSARDADEASQPPDDNAKRPRHHTKAGVLLGTPVYMPQEQWEDAGAIDHRADLYALGVSAYQLLSGRLPYSGSNAVQILKQVIRGERAPVSELAPEVDATLEAILDRMMAPERSRRYPRADEALADLRAWHAAQNSQPLPRVDEPSPVLSKVGDTFLHYELIEYRNRLGSCEIWLARNLGTQQTALLKIVRDARAIERLRNQEAFIGKLCELTDRPTMLALRDVLIAHQPPIVVFEPPAGRTLREQVREHGPLSEQRTINLLIGLAGALSEAHRAGVVHGNLRETHILVEPHGTHDVRAKLFNFGTLTDTQSHPLALKLDAPEPAASGHISHLHLAIVDWLPPEVAEGGELTPSSDLYGLGLIGVYALTGKRPGRNLQRQIEDAPVSQTLKRLLGTLTEESPAARPSSAHDALKSLMQAKLLGTLGATPPVATRGRAVDRGSSSLGPDDAPPRAAGAR